MVSAIITGNHLSSGVLFRAAGTVATIYSAAVIGFGVFLLASCLIGLWSICRSKGDHLHT
jgi:hypothetical protein